MALDPVTMGLIVDYVVIPVVRKMAARRGIHNIRDEDITAFINDPKKAIGLLKDSKEMHEEFIENLTDGIDKLLDHSLGNVIDIVFGVFTALTTPGGTEDGSSGDN